MSKQFFPTSEALKKLEYKLTCPICLEHFTNPKTLPCLHSFCQHCLQAVPLDLVQSDKYQLPCPTCRSSCELPETGVEALPTFFLINKLTEVYNLLKKVSGSGDVSCDNCEKKTSASGYCKKCGLFYCDECLDHHQKLRFTADHKILTLDKIGDMADQIPVGKGMKCSNHNKPLSIYCRTCEKLICQYCTGNAHEGHEYDALIDAYQRNRQELEIGTVQPLKEQVTRISEALAKLIKRRDQVTQQGEKVKEEIHTAAQDIVKQLHETERQLTEEVNKAVEIKVGILNGQIKSAESALDQLTECLKYIEKSLHEETPQEMLFSKAQIKNQSTCVVSDIENIMFEPSEQADITFSKKYRQTFGIPNNIGSIHYSVFPASKVSLSMEQLPLVSRESTCTLSLSSCDGSPVLVPSSLISCSLSTPDSKLSIECSVKESKQTGEYTVTFTPITSSSHQLHVRIGKSHVRGSPVSIPVSVPPEKRGVPTKVITGLNGPWGVAVTKEGQVIVSEYDVHSVAVFNTKGKKIRFGSKGIGRGQFQGPTGVSVTGNGSILVADCDNHRIQQFTMDGGFISCVGSKGTGPLQFSSPRGIAVNKITGQVFVADTKNDRIQVLNPDLSFSNMFGTSGSKEGQFDAPWDVTVDNRGMLLIADSDNHRIQQFTADGKFVSMFNTDVKYPVGITSHDGVIYVSHHGNNSVCMYTSNGRYISSIGGKDGTFTTLQLKCPQHLIVDSNGYLYVCDYINYRVLMF